MLLKCSNMEKRFVTNGKGKARGCEYKCGKDLVR